MVKFMYFVFISLLVLVSGCADDSSSGSSNQNVSTGDTVGTVGGNDSAGGTESLANIKEYFTAGSSSSAAVNAKALYRDDDKRNDFEYNDDIDGVRLFFRYTDNTTSEAVYNINGQSYHAIVDDMVYTGHNWIGLELEQLYDVNGKPNYAASRNDRIGLLNIKTGEIIVMENQVFSRCQDLETLEVLGNNKAYFLCENSAYSLDLGTKEVVQIGASKNDKFDDSYAVIFADGTGVYQAERENGRPSDIKVIENDSIVTGDITELPVKYFKNSSDEILYFGTDKLLYNLSLENGLLKAAAQNLDEVIPATALGPVRNEDDTTAKFISRQVMVDTDAFYTYDIKTNTVTKTLWNNTDFTYMKPFIQNSEDAEEHIFFGENGIAYVAGNNIKYIAYAENASPKPVALPAGVTGRYEIDDITLIGNVLYFQLEDERTETFYRADISQEEIKAEVYTGDKSIMKVIDIDITVTTPEDNNNTGGTTGGSTGDTTGDTTGGTTGDTTDGTTGGTTGDTTGENTGTTSGSQEGSAGTGNTETGTSTDNTGSETGTETPLS